MRVLVIDPDPARAALVAEGLKGIEPLEVRQAAVFVAAEALSFAPDVIVVACDSPDRDTLESLRDATAGNPRPVVMFADRSEPWRPMWSTAWPRPGSVPCSKPP
jgi:response regulator NasT